MNSFKNEPKVSESRRRLEGGDIRGCFGVNGRYLDTVEFLDQFNSLHSNLFLSDYKMTGIWGRQGCSW